MIARHMILMEGYFDFGMVSYNTGFPEDKRNMKMLKNIVGVNFEKRSFSIMLVFVHRIAEKESAGSGGECLVPGDGKLIRNKKVNCIFTSS